MKIKLPVTGKKSLRKVYASNVKKVIYYVYANSLAFDDLETIIKFMKKDFPLATDIRIHHFGYPRYSFESAYGVSMKIEKAPSDIRVDTSWLD
ncbi:hypothetical protein COB64_03735 [Candidatus Wolfebacteria bacterium]|nr:MAG: hypothetical protein COB64_03735 [Candidatus Wolfebacteria bacterium]